MEVKAKVTGGTLSLIIDGHINGIVEVSKIKDIIKTNGSATIVELIIKDAFVIPSAMIGLLLKEANANKKKIILKASKQELKNLISELNLTSIIDVR